MTGTFASFNTALTALRYSQIATDVASENIANASTTGYTKKTVVATEGVGEPHAAVWATNDGTENFGVTVASISRDSDDTLSARARSEHAKDTYLSTSSDVLTRVEDSVNEPSDSGLSNALSKFRSSWSPLANIDNTTNREAVLSAAATVATAINSQAASVESEASSDRLSVQGDVKQVNTLAAEIADINSTIASAGSSGVSTADLEDKRDQYTLSLSKLTGATTTLNEDGTATVTLGGATLVAGAKAGTLSIASGINADGTADGTSIGYTVTDPSSTTTSVSLTGTSSGELGAYTDALNTTIPNYLTGLNTVASTLADDVNSKLATGYDSNGDAGTALFSYTAGSAASTLKVAITDSKKLAVSATSGTADTSVATSLGTLKGAETSYTNLVSTFASTVSSTNALSANQSTLTSSIDDDLASKTSVDSSEELVNLTIAQHQYAAAARVITTLDSMLDTLVNMGA